MLTTYQTRTQQLLQNPKSPSTLYATADLTSWINQARGQLAGESESIRFLATISTALGQRNYQFSALNTGIASANGIAGVFHIRSMRYAVGNGFQWVYSRAWPWFEFFYLNNPVPGSGAPIDYAQHKQGSAGTGTGSGATGSVYLEPIPDLVYTLTCDSVCFPQALATDADIEAIPWPFTDAVPFLAAYYALLSAQTNARMADAERLWGYYQTYKDRARQFSNPDLSRGLYEQATDVTLTNKLGIGGGTGQG